MSYRAANATIQEILGEALPTAGGVYYVARYPKGWRLEPNKDDIDPTLDHLGLWEEISYLLACQWAGKVPLSKATLHERLMPLSHAFPRGRVVVQGLKHFVRHGNNLEDFMGVTQRQIECYYGLVQPEWNLDSHEKCSGEHQTRIRELLGITEVWKSV